ncbi:MAG: LysR family transcriptional regulator [Microbacteriaceae bacterium]|nr:LysR family transcriptional regulator [Microbacteriaceae bacterium]
MNVELRHLAMLVALERTGSFTDAAAELGCSQAAMSRGVQALEAAVGAPLVLRTTRAVAFTPAGSAFCADARRILDDADRAVARARGETRSIRIGYAWAALGAHTTPMLRAWNRAHPEQPIRMVHANRHDVGLRDGSADLAIVRHPMDDREFEWSRIGFEARVCSLAVDHPLAERVAIRLDDLRHARVGSDAATGTTTAALWLEQGMPAPELVPTHDTDEWLDLVAEGRIVGVTPVATAHYSPRPGVVFLPMPDAPRIEVRLAWRRGRRHPETDRVLRHLRGYYR